MKLSLLIGVAIPAVIHAFILPSKIIIRPLQLPHAASTSEPVEGLHEEAAAIVQDAQRSLRPAFEEVDQRTQRTLKRILTSFRKHQVKVETAMMVYLQLALLVVDFIMSNPPRRLERIYSMD